MMRLYEFFFGFVDVLLNNQRFAQSGDRTLHKVPNIKHNVRVAMRFSTVV